MFDERCSLTETGTVKLLMGLRIMSYRRLFLTAAATSLALAACDQKPAGPVTGAPIASLPLAQTPPPVEPLAPYPEALPPAPPLPRIAHPKRPAYAYLDDAYQ